jgi:hypothetical protein
MMMMKSNVLSVRNVLGEEYRRPRTISLLVWLAAETPVIIMIVLNSSSGCNRQDVWICFLVEMMPTTFQRP